MKCLFHRHPVLFLNLATLPRVSPVLHFYNKTILYKTTRMKSQKFMFNRVTNLLKALQGLPTTQGSGPSPPRGTQVPPCPDHQPAFNFISHCPTKPTLWPQHSVGCLSHYDCGRTVGDGSLTCIPMPSHTHTHLYHEGFFP